MIRVRWCALVLVLTLACLGAASVPVLAQDVTTEDRAAVLLETARSFERDGRTELAEALYEYILERFPDSPAGRELRETLPDRGGQVRLERSGSVELQVWSALYGGWLGIAVPGMAGAEDAAAYGAGLLLGAPVMFLAGRSYLGDRRVTEGHARAITWGGTWGSWQGLGWAQVFDFGARCFDDSFRGRQVCEGDPSAEATFGSMVAGGLLGIGIGGLVANRTEVGAGTSTLANVGSLWGSWYGLSTGVVADVDDDELWGWVLTAGNAGLVSMALLGPRWDMRRERVRMISIAGFIGLAAGFGLDLIVQPDSERVVMLIPTATSAAGLAIGAAATRGMDRSPRTGAVPEGLGGLVEWRDGTPGLGIPTATPTWVWAPTGTGGAALRPALRLNLFSARF